MLANRLHKVALLDPRNAPQPPIAEAVAIPTTELARRVFELPAPADETGVADVEGGREAVEWLTSRGRRGHLVKDFTFGQAGRCRLWSPNEFLERTAADLVPGRALDLGCGAGRDAVHLASMGWEVTAADLLPDAIERTAALAERYLGEPDGKVTLAVLDLDRELPEGEFDLIVSFFGYDLDWIKRALPKLAKGGSLVLESFTAGHRAASGHPRGERRAIEPDALEAALKDVSPRTWETAADRGRETLRVWAQRA